MSEQIKVVEPKVTKTGMSNTGAPASQVLQSDISVRGEVKDLGRVRYGGGAMPF